YYPSGLGRYHCNHVFYHVAVSVCTFLHELVRLGAGRDVLLPRLLDLSGGVSEFRSHPGLWIGRDRARQASPALGNDRYPLARAASHLYGTSLRDRRLVYRDRFDRS